MVHGRKRRRRPVPKGRGPGAAQSLAASRHVPAPVSDDVAVSDWMDAFRVRARRATSFLGWASFTSGADPAEVSMLEVMALVAEGDGCRRVARGRDRGAVRGWHSPRCWTRSSALRARGQARRAGVRVDQERRVMRRSAARRAEERCEAGRAVRSTHSARSSSTAAARPPRRRCPTRGTSGRSRSWFLLSGAPEGLACLGYGHDLAARAAWATQASSWASPPGRYKPKLPSGTTHRARIPSTRRLGHRPLVAWKLGRASRYGEGSAAGFARRTAGSSSRARSHRRRAGTHARWALSDVPRAGARSYGDPTA